MKYSEVTNLREVYEGRKVKSCLDMEKPMYEYSSSDTGRLDWFTGTVVDCLILDKVSPIADVIIKRDDHSNGGWTIRLNKNTYRYFMVGDMEWDD